MFKLSQDKKISNIIKQRTETWYLARVEMLDVMKGLQKPKTEGSV